MACVFLAALSSDIARSEVIARPAETTAPVILGSTKGIRPNRLVIRGGTMISGRGVPGTGRAAPPEGPVDIIVEKGRILDIIPLDPVSLAGGLTDRASGDLVIDATGKYVLPGLFDLHAHIPAPNWAGNDAIAYSFRLWLGHGVTTLRDAGAGAGLTHLSLLRRQSDEHSITAPRLRLHARWPNTGRSGNKGHTADEARALVRKFRQQGADGIKVSHGPGLYPDVLAAIVEESAELEMDGVVVDLKVSETDARVASNAGVASIEHWYGVPEAALPGTQNFPANYNYLDELTRFRQAGYLWQEAAAYPEALSKVVDDLIHNGTAWVPTFQVYEANLDFMRAITLPWRERFVHPEILARWKPQAGVHASFHSEWTTADEVAWKQNFQQWMTWVHEFWQRGGQLGLGSDSGALQSIYGFSIVRELELLQQAGIHPLDVIRIATTNSAKIMRLDDELCGIRYDCVADLIIVDGNPIENFKVLYGGGYAYFGTGKSEQGGVIWTIKEGEVFDARALLREAEWYVRQDKAPGTNAE